MQGRLQERFEGGLVSPGVPGERPGQEWRGQASDPRDLEEDVARESRALCSGGLDKVRGRPGDLPVGDLEGHETSRLVGGVPVPGLDPHASEPAHEQVLGADADGAWREAADLVQPVLPARGVGLVGHEREDLCGWALDLQPRRDVDRPPHHNLAPQLELITSCNH